MASKQKKKRGRKADATGRSKGEEQYFGLGYPMARSTAWRSLSGSALKVFIELRCRYNGFNNGDLSLSLDEGARLLGVGKTTVGRALKELEAKGFIVMTKRGQWYGRMATTWRVTDKHCNGHPPTNDWKKWRPEKKERNSGTRFWDGPYCDADGTATEPKP